MMTLRLWIYGAIAGLLLLVCATTVGYQHGRTVERSIVLVQHDDSINKVNNAKAARDSERAALQTDSLKVVLMQLRSDSVKQERAQAKRDTSKALAHGERALFTLQGDTAYINGQAYVLPKTVATYVRFTDTLTAKQAELDAIEAQSDSNYSRTIARLESLNTAKDTLITDLKVTITDQQGEIKDLQRESRPRFGFLSGLVSGGGIVGILFFLIK